MNSAEKWEVTKAEARRMSTDELNEALEKKYGEDWFEKGFTPGDPLGIEYMERISLAR